MAVEDPDIRIRRLVAKFEPDIARMFLEMVADIQDVATLEELAHLLETGRTNEAMALGQAHVERFANRVTRLIVVAGESTEAFLISRGIEVNYDAVNVRAVREMQANRTRMITEITQDQREAIRYTLSEGVRQGLNPKEQARMFRRSIGLTSQQAQAVVNYRRQLEQGNRAALDRALRDRRFDRTVTGVVEGTRPPLTEAELDRMTERYRQRWLKFRAESIARTEALGAANTGSYEMYRQAVDNGVLNLDDIEREWEVKLDGREREWHHTMSGQKRRLDEQFESGQGNLLWHPGDMNAPYSEIGRCRCGVSVRIKTGSLREAA